MSKIEVKVFGIRHHGPGSARRLLGALSSYQPDYLLIEFPADANTHLVKAASLGLKPPVAMVMYAQNNLGEASYFPFAAFSPEWQALQWGQAAGVGVEAMDLPFSHSLGLRNNRQLRVTAKHSNEDLLQDPLGYAASLAGFEDVEQWWETTFEQESDDLALFDAVNTLMETLREASELTYENALREAYMRKVLRAAVASGQYQRVAVVCGAWHAPALSQWTQYKASADTQALRGLSKEKVDFAWIPWSYPRLAKMSGYGAGVISPAWYDLIFEFGNEAPMRWMLTLARLLRDEGMDVSPAHTTEALRLANTLAQIQQQHLPNLEGLLAAALSVLCHGDEAKLALIIERLQMGGKVGHVPANAIEVPLQKDFNKQLKSTRLNKYWGITGAQWLKPLKGNPEAGGLDLREQSDLDKSEFLHQLNVLDIKWGTVQAERQQDLGRFKERWKLHWQPEFAFNVLEAAMWGNTVREAAAQKLLQTPPDAGVMVLAQTILTGLKAGLIDSANRLTLRLNDRAAMTRDAFELLLGIVPLVNIIHFGDARKTDVTALAGLLEGLIPRIGVGLPSLASQIDDEQAASLLKNLLPVHYNLGLLDWPVLQEAWWPALLKLADLPGCHPLLQGAAVRLLFDKQLLHLEAVTIKLSYALSPGQTHAYAAAWLAGFLHGSGLLLLHHRPLWQLVDDWIAGIHIDALTEMLPILRRAFANFSAGERAKMLALARQSLVLPTADEQGHSPHTTDVAALDEKRATVLAEGWGSWME